MSQGTHFQAEVNTGTREILLQGLVKMAFAAPQMQQRRSGQITGQRSAVCDLARFQNDELAELTGKLQRLGDLIVRRADYRPKSGKIGLYANSIAQGV